MATQIETLRHLVAVTSGGDGVSDEVEKIAFQAISNALFKADQIANSSQDAKSVRVLALKALTNLTDVESRCKVLLTDHKEVIDFCLKEVCSCPTEKGSSDLWTTAIGALSNVTRHKFWVEAITESPKEKFRVDALLTGLPDAAVASLLPLVLNLTQAAPVRSALCRPPHRGLARLLSFLEPGQGPETRRLAAGVLKNVCFEDECHRDIVSAEGVNALPAILRPLVSHVDYESGAIDEEDADEFPASVQAVLKDPKHARDSDEEVRLRLVKAMLQLCATPVGREALGDANAYIALRELYMWEKNHGSRAVALEAQHVIDVLISESEPNPEQILPDYDRSANFRHVAVTEEDAQFVERLDQQFLDK